MTESTTMVIGAAHPPSGPLPGSSGAVLLQVVGQACTDALGKGGRYTGQLDVASGLPHGTGQMNYDEKDPEEEEDGNNNNENSHDNVASYHGEWWYGYWQGGSPSNTCRLRNGDVYCGSLRQHERHGVGLYTWADARTTHKSTNSIVKQRSYQGQFHCNQRQGHGKYTWRTIDLSSRKVLSESVYTGSFRDGQRQGHGVYLGPTLRYTGEWFAGKYHGYGVLEEHLVPSTTTSPNGEAAPGLRTTVYKGYFEKGRKHGRGCQHAPALHKTIHDGLWEKDAPVKEEPAPPLPPPPSGGPIPRPAGVATAGRSVSSVVFSQPQPLADALGGKGLYKGIVQDGLPQGVGTMVYDPPSLAGLHHHLGQTPSQQHSPDQVLVGGSIAEYEGFWQAGHHHGFGRIRYQSGDTYEGNFVRNAKEGRGEYTYLEEALANTIGQPRRVYKGSFARDVPHGPGFSVVYPNGDLFVGDYENGQRHGNSGRMEFANGSYYAGPFCEGMYHTTTDSPCADAPAADAADHAGDDAPPTTHGRLVTEHIVYVGPFEKGVFHGPNGKLCSATTDQVLYEGEFIRGKPADDSVRLNPEDLRIPHPPLDDPFADTDADSEDERAFLEANVVMAAAASEKPVGLVEKVVSAASPMLLDRKSLRRPIPKGTVLPPTLGRAASGSGNPPPPPPPAPLIGIGGGKPIPVAPPPPAPPTSRPSITSSIWEALGGTPSAANSRKTTAAPTPAATIERKKEEDCKAVVDMEVWDGQENPGRYTGLLHLETQRPHGVGRMVYQDGNRIHEGFWVYGHRQGHGRCLFVAIGDYHEGNYHENLRHGPGRYHWKDGRRFEGTYHEDERHGHGVFTYPNGDSYDGDFVRGQRCGQGTFCFGGPDRRCRYKGGWKDGVYEGSGRLEWRDNAGRFRVYEGGFQRGVFHGAGAEQADGEPLRHGIWHEGEHVPDGEPLPEEDSDHDNRPRRPSPPPEAFGHARRIVGEEDPGAENEDVEVEEDDPEDDGQGVPELVIVDDGPSEADDDDDETTHTTVSDAPEASVQIVDLGALASSEPTRRSRPRQKAPPRKHPSSVECASGQTEAAQYELQRLQWKNSIGPEI